MFALVFVLQQPFWSQVRIKALLCQILQKTYGNKYEEHLFTLTRGTQQERKGCTIVLMIEILFLETCLVLC